MGRRASAKAVLVIFLILLVSPMASAFCQGASGTQEQAKLLLGTWDRFDPESGEKLNAYEFRARGAEIEVQLKAAFGEIVVPVKFDGKKVKFKYLYKTYSSDTEYEIDATLEPSGIMRGHMNSLVTRSNPGFPLRPGHKGRVKTEFRKR